MGFYEFLISFTLVIAIFRLFQDLIERIQEVKMEELRIKGVALQYQQDQVDKLLQAPRE